MSDDSEQKKVVNLAQARQRQQTLRPKPKPGQGRQGASGQGAGKAQQPRLWVYLQLIVFLAIVSYMMTLCRH